MFLDSNKKLVAVLTTAKTTLNLPVTVDYVDLTATTTTPAPNQTYTNGITPVDILASPAASTIRKVNGLSIYGRDTAAKIVRIYTIDATPTTGLITAGAFVAGNDYQIVSVGTTDFTLIGASANTVGVIFTATGVGTGTGTASTAYQHVDLTLQIDDTLCYTDVNGWYTIDPQGNLKSVQAASATSIANAITTSTEKVTPVAADKVGIVDSVTGLLNWSSFTDLLNFFVGLTTNQSIAGIKTFTTQLIGKGTATNDSAAAGYIGEYVESLQTVYTNFPANGTWGDMASISLTAGDWDISMTLSLYNNSATTTLWVGGIGTASGNSSTGTVAGVNLLPALTTTGTNENGLSIPPYRASIASTTIFYAKVFANYSAGTPQNRGRISARRIR